MAWWQELLALLLTPLRTEGWERAVPTLFISLSPSLSLSLSLSTLSNFLLLRIESQGTEELESRALRQKRGTLPGRNSSLYFAPPPSSSPLLSFSNH